MINGRAQPRGWLTSDEELATCRTNQDLRCGGSYFNGDSLSPEHTDDSRLRVTTVDFSLRGFKRSGVHTDALITDSNLSELAALALCAIGASLAGAQFVEATLMYVGLSQVVPPPITLYGAQLINVLLPRKIALATVLGEMWLNA